MNLQWACFNTGKTLLNGYHLALDKSVRLWYLCWNREIQEPELVQCQFCCSWNILDRSVPWVCWS
jgi:hypothetical protein